MPASQTERGGCLREIGALFSALVIGVAAVTGLVLRCAWADTLGGRLAGAAIVAAAGGATILGSKSRAFANVFHGLISTRGRRSWLEGTESYERDYVAQTGVHPAPVVAGVVMLLAAVLMAVLGP